MVMMMMMMGLIRSLTGLALGLVVLLCGSPVYGSAPGSEARDGADGCSDKMLHQILSGSRLSHCGQQTFNPAESTCCEVRRGDHITAEITDRLSEEVSDCCELQAFNPLNEICCQSTVLARPAANAQCHGREAYDTDGTLFCGPNDKKVILKRKSREHQCCGRDQYNTKTQCCCEINDSLQVRPVTSYDCKTSCESSENHIPDEQKNAIDKPSSMTDLCSAGVFDVESQLCCGPNDKKVILKRKSREHQCCGRDQYNTKTQCCCEINDSLQVRPVTSYDCKTFCESASCKSSENHIPDEQNAIDKPSSMTDLCSAGVFDVESQLCCGPNDKKVILNRMSSEHQCCGQDQYNNKTQCCCEINDSLQVRPVTSCDCKRNVATTEPNSHTHCCCDGCLSESKLKNDEFQCPPENHYCGKDVYNPSFQICCSGHSHTKGKNIHCCGTEAYDIKNPQMKCCAGTLHNLTLLSEAAQKAQCCGARLQEQQDICCSSETKQLLYSVKDGLQCCSHLYYNTSLWSCCAGKLAPLPRPQPRSNNRKKESRLLSINNLNKQQLCEKIKLGIVESVSQQSIVLKHVLKIYGKGGCIYPLPHSMVEITGPDPCSFPELTPGKSYFFDEAHFYVDLNHNSVLEALYFIVSKCFS